MPEKFKENKKNGAVFTLIRVPNEDERGNKSVILRLMAEDNSSRDVTQKQLEKDYKPA